MATVYRVVKVREDGTIASYEGTAQTPGSAKALLRRVRQSIGHKNPSGVVGAKIQQIDGDWVDSPGLMATQSYPAESADPNRKTTFSKQDDNPLPFNGAGFVSTDDPPTEPHAIAAGLHRNLGRKRGKQFPLT